MLWPARQTLSHNYPWAISIKNSHSSWDKPKVATWLNFERHSQAVVWTRNRGLEPLKDSSIPTLHHKQKCINKHWFQSTKKFSFVPMKYLKMFPIQYCNSSPVPSLGLPILPILDHLFSHRSYHHWIQYTIYIIIVHTTVILGLNTSSLTTRKSVFFTAVSSVLTDTMA